MEGIAKDHSYDNHVLLLDDQQEFPELPITPSKPPLAKKPTLQHWRKDNAIPDDSVRALAKLINSRSDALEKMLEAVQVNMQTLNDKVSSMEKRVQDFEVAGEDCKNRVADLERYGRRWNLILYGVPEPEENTKENALNMAIVTCEEILPSGKEKLPDGIDIAHRLGKNRRVDGKPRGIIIPYSSHEE